MKWSIFFFCSVSALLDGCQSGSGGGSGRGSGGGASFKDDVQSSRRDPGASSGSDASRAGEASSASPSDLDEILTIAAEDAQRDGERLDHERLADGIQSPAPTRRAADPMYSKASENKNSEKIRVRRGGDGVPRGATVLQILDGLRAGPPDDMDAQREIKFCNADLIPRLIEAVESKETTRIFKIEVPAYHDEIAIVDDDDKNVIYYFVKGMGRFHFDEVATGALQGKVGTRVIFRKYREPFSLGEVTRASLLYRFSSRNYPRDVDDKDNLVAWWARYFEMNRRRL